MHRHPANRARHDNASRGQRTADKVCGFLGSWRFIGIQTVVIVVWIAVNVAAVVGHWDPYPFILLNLVFSTQAAYASPLILLAQNVQSEHDRRRAEEDFAADSEALRLLRQIAEGKRE